MKILTPKFFDQFEPCYPPGDALGCEWKGTIVDLLKIDTIDVEDKLWAATRPGILSDKTLRLFAVACAKSVSHLIIDPRSLNAIEVAERFARGNASQKELAAAGSAARSAAWAAAWSAAGAAAWAAAWDDQIKILLEIIEQEEV